MNIHIHTTNLDYSSRVLKCLTTAARSGCFQARTFIGAGVERQYQLEDTQGIIQVQIFNRWCDRRSSFLRKVMATLLWTRRAKAYGSGLPASCINVHGLSTLPLGVALKRRHHCKLIYDTHELESRAFAVRGLRRLYSESLERALIHHCDAVICVSDGIADWYERHYGIARPLVVRNVPDLRMQAAAATAAGLRARCGVPADAVLFLYHGLISAGRHVERFIDVFARLSRDRHLVFMGLGPLEDLVRQASARHPNIHYHPAVPPNQVLAHVAQADVGLVGVENVCLSYYLTIANKLFECLAAGVPVIVPDFPVMKQLVDQHQCGWRWRGDSVGLASLVGGLSLDEIKQKKRHAQATGPQLTWENEEQKLLQLYRKLLAECRVEPMLVRTGGQSTGHIPLPNPAGAGELAVVADRAGTCRAACALSRR